MREGYFPEVESKEFFWDNPNFESSFRKGLYFGSIAFGMYQRIARPGAYNRFINFLEKLHDFYVNENLWGEEFKCFNAVFKLEESEKEFFEDLDLEIIKKVIRDFNIDKVEKYKENEEYWTNVEKVGKFIRPMWYVKKELQDNNEGVKEFFIALENVLTYAIWASPPSVMNPFYEAMRKNFPVLELLNRITYLNRLYHLENKQQDSIQANLSKINNPDNKDKDDISKKDDNEDIFQCCLGLSYKIVELKDDGSMIAGGTWLNRGDGFGSSIPDKKTFITKVYDTVEKKIKVLNKFSDFFENDKSSSITIPHKLFFKNMALRFDMVDIYEFNLKTKKLSIFNQTILDFLKKCKDELENISGGFVLLLCEWLVFLINLHGTNISYEYSINNKEKEFTQKDEDIPKKSFFSLIKNFIKCLSNGSEKDIEAFSDINEEKEKSVNAELIVNLKNDSITFTFPVDIEVDDGGKNYIGFKGIDEFKMTIKKHNNREDKEKNSGNNTPKDNIKIIFKLDNETVSNKEFGKILINEFGSFRRNFKRFSAFKERIFFSKTRHIIQQFEDDNVDDIIKIFVKAAMVLGVADYGTFYFYLGNEDRLSPVFIERSFLFRKRGYKEKKSIENKMKEETKQLAEKQIAEWTKEKRSKSSIYKALDEKKVYPDFNDNEEKSIKTLNFEDKKGYFSEERDVLSIPVFAHGVLQGILHLATKRRCQFTCDERLRVLSFVQMFEEFIWRARVFHVNRELANLLSLTLTSKQLKDDFYGLVCKKLRKLLSASAVALYMEDMYKQERGWYFMGKDSGANFPFKEGSVDISKKKLQNFLYFYEKDKGIDTFFESNINLKEISNDFKNSKTFLINLFLDLEKKEKKPKGFFVVFAKTIERGTPFENEMKFLALRFAQAILHYREHMSQLRSIGAFLSHDLSGALKGVSSGTERLEEKLNNILKREIDKQTKEKIRLILDDIKEQTEYANHLVSLVASKELEKLAEYELSRGLGILILYESPDKYRKREFVRFWDVFQKAVHSREKELNNKKVWYREENSEGFKKIKEIEFWLFKTALKHVVENLIDNISKYALKYTQINLFYKETPSKVLIGIRNKGKRMCEKGEKDKSFVFRKKERCIRDEDKIEGQGMGLYISKNLCKTWDGDLIFEYKIIDYEHAYYTFWLMFPKYLTDKKLFIKEE